MARKQLNVYMACGLVLFFAIAGFCRNDIWSNDLKLWNDVVLKSPIKVRPRTELGTMYHLVMRDFDKALQAYQLSLAMDPVQSPIIYNNIASVYFDKKQYEESVHYFTLLISFEANNHRTYYLRGNAFFKMDNYERAISDYDKSLSLNQTDPEVYLNRGAAYYNSGDILRARSDYKRACAMGNESGCVRSQELREPGK